MDITVYKLIHVVGILVVFLSLGGTLIHAINGGAAAHAWRKANLITHGVGMLLVLFGGFGLLAKLQVFWPMPAWAILKILIWVALGGLPTLVTRQPNAAKTWWWLTIVLAVLAAYLGGMKPF